MILSGPWITQTLGFAGASGAVGYLPSQKLTIAVEATNGPGAYDAKGNAGLGAVALFRELADRTRTAHAAGGAACEPLTHDLALSAVRPQLSPSRQRSCNST